MLKLLMVLRVALTALTVNKMRAFLTMLGIVIGVAAVIAMVSIGAGAKQEAIRQIELMGMNTIYVRPKELHGDALREAKRKSPDGLVIEDLVSINDICPLVERGAAVKEIDEEIRHRGRSPESNIIGTDPSYVDVTSSALEKGRFLTNSDLKAYARVCVIGSDIKRDLFAFDDPLREQIRIGKEWFRIVGVMASKQISKGRTNVVSVRNLNRDVYIPVTTAEERFIPDPEKEQRGLTEIAMTVTSSDKIREAANIVDSILRIRHIQDMG